MSLVMSVRAGIRVLLMLGCIACLLPAALQAEPQQVKVGLYVTQLSDIDIPKQAFNAHSGPGTSRRTTATSPSTLSKS